LSSNAQIRALTRLIDRRAPSSQRGGQGFESPQLHPRYFPDPEFVRAGQAWRRAPDHRSGALRVLGYRPTAHHRV